MKLNILPEGLWPVMLTPFKRNGSIDYVALEELIEFYLDSGSSGLFANCLSSEMYHLSPEERIELVRFVLQRTNGRVPVVATGTFGMNLDVHIRTIKILHELGVAAVILVTSLIARASESDEIFKNKMNRILAGTQSIPLGLYECPEPYKRLLEPDMVEYLANTGRFLFYKETSCDTRVMKTKLARLKNTTLCLYNANTPTALDSLHEGAHGLSVISANFYPEFYVSLWKGFKSREDLHQITLLQQNLSIMDAVTRIKYPLSAKMFLAWRGLKIDPFTRVKVPPLVFEEKMMLEALFHQFEMMQEQFNF